MASKVNVYISNEEHIIIKVLNEKTNELNEINTTESKAGNGHVFNENQAQISRKKMTSTLNKEETQISIEKETRVSTQSKTCVAPCSRKTLWIILFCLLILLGGVIVAFPLVFLKQSRKTTDKKINGDEHKNAIRATPSLLKELSRFTTLSSEVKSVC